MEVSVDGPTVRVAEPEMEPKLAVIVVVPPTRVVAKPVVLIEATDVFEETQLTSFVRSRALPSLQVPVALNCCVVFGVTDGAAGVTAIELRIGVTVRPFDPLTPPMAAVIVVVPLARPVANPETTEAELPELDVHIA